LASRAVLSTQQLVSVPVMISMAAPSRSSASGKPPAGQEKAP
jgi:hypothetical protein